jgi:acyl carrier protein
MKLQILTGLAEILEVDSVSEETELAKVGNWDSMSVVCTIALLDEKAGAEVDGEALANCRTAGDVLALAGISPSFEVTSMKIGDKEYGPGVGHFEIIKP